MKKIRWIYPNDAYYNWGYKAGHYDGYRLAARIGEGYALASVHFCQAMEAGTHIALRRGNVPLSEVGNNMIDGKRLDSMAAMLMDSVIRRNYE